MNALTFRHAKAADLQFIIELIRIDDVTTSVDDETANSSPPYLEALAAIDANPNEELYIAELAGVPVGTFQLSFIPGIMRRGMWRGVVESVHIAPVERNHGYGKQMMRWAVERCRARGCGMVQLTSNKQRVDAHRFYRALGFTQSHEGFKLFL